MAVAFCWRSGQIEVGQRCPPGAITLLRGRRALVLRVVVAEARLERHPSKVMLVPGVAEAADLDAALEAIHRFKRRVQQAYAALPKGEVR